jgi:hypothetical protein
MTKCANSGLNPTRAMVKRGQLFHAMTTKNHVFGFNQPKAKAF